MSRRKAAAAAPHSYCESSGTDDDMSMDAYCSSAEQSSGEEEAKKPSDNRQMKQRNPPKRKKAGGPSEKKGAKATRAIGKNNASSAAAAVGSQQQQLLDDVAAPFESGPHVLELMRVAYTGARVGDVLEGTNPVTKSALLRVCGAHILPMKRKLDEVRSSPGLWLGFLHQLATISFFSPMSIVERDAWLANNQLSKERMGSEDNSALDAVRFQVLSLGSSVLGSDKIAEQHVLELMEEEPREWKATDIARMIPANEESNSSADSGRHTLFFIKSWWKISSDAQVVAEFAGPTIGVTCGQVYTQSGVLVQASQHPVQLYVFEGVSSSHAGKVSLAVPQMAGINTSFDHLLDAVVLPVLSESPDLAIDGAMLRQHALFVEQQLRPLSGAALKSILQKLIRYPSSTITGFFQSQQTVVDSRIHLVVVCCVLLHRPPTFNEDIGRHVSGLESFLKRLAVILFEDASFTDGGSTALSLLAGAFMAQRIRGWRPPASLLKQWLRAAVAAQTTVSAFYYDAQKGIEMAPLQLQGTSTAMPAASVLLDALKSFKGDLGMVRFIATYAGGPLLVTAGSSVRESMPFAHFIDQHAYPNVCYEYDQCVIDQVCAASPPGRPFSALSDKLFRDVTGMNPRRVQIDHDAFEQLPFVHATRMAQQRTLFAQLCRPAEMQTQQQATGEYAFQHELDRAWLAGMVGAIELKSRPRNARTGVEARVPLLVMLSCDDPAQLFVIRKPARGLKPEQEHLTDQVEAEAIAEARAILSAGTLQLRAIHRPPVAEWKNATIRWDDAVNDYWIESSREGVPARLWEQLRSVDTCVPVFKAQPFDAQAALTSRSIGIQEGAFNRLEDLVLRDSLSTNKLIYRVQYYLRTFEHEVAMHRIARDGSGLDRQVNTIDGDVYRWLLHLSWLFPGALRPATSHLHKFVVPNGLLLWHVVDKLRILLDRRIAHHPASGAVAYWPHHCWVPPMPPWLHQSNAFEDMKSKHARGRKEQYLRSPAGSGKTLMVSLYLKYLASMGKLTDHVLWSGPEESLASVTQELQSFGFVVDWMIPLKGAKKKKLPRGVELRAVEAGFACFRITMVDHEHLRRIPELLRNTACNMFLVMDEVHRTLSDTQRTSIALEVAALSAGGFVALTGTPTIDNKIYKLLPWLSLIVPFIVNKHNFWAACNSWISQVASTGVHVRVHDVEVVWPRDTNQEQEYRALVPEKLGGRNNFPTRLQIQQATNICYDVCTAEMARLALDLLYNKLGYGRADVWKGGIFMVAENAVHQTKLRQMLVTLSQQQAGAAAAAAAAADAQMLREQDIFLISSNERVHLTDATVASGASPDHPIVITTKRKSLGYTVSRLKASVTSVYPSNFADRTQLDARVNRLSQAAKELDYYVVSIGLLSIIRKYHNEAASIDRALKDMAIAISNVDA